MPKKKSVSTDVPSNKITEQNKVLTIQEIYELDQRLRFDVAEEYNRHGCVEKCRYIMQDSGYTMKRTKLIGLNSAYDTCALIFKQKTLKHANETKWIVNQLTRIGDNLIVNATAYCKDHTGNLISNSYVFGKYDKPTFQKHYSGFDSVTGAVIEGDTELVGYETKFYLSSSKEQVLELAKHSDENGKTSLIVNTGNRKYSVETLSDFYHGSWIELKHALLPKSKSVFDTNNTGQVGQAAK
jgi:hypothetical protein